MLLIIRCNNIFDDPRVEKYIKYLEQHQIDYRVLGWNRLGEKICSTKGFFFQLRSSFGKGGLIAIVHRIKWMSFVIKYLIHNNSQFHVVHACDLDSVFPACFYKFFFKKKIKVIFDVFDWYSATLYQEGRFIRIIFYLMEKFSIMHSDEVIICEPERIRQIPFSLNKKELVFPNIPYFYNLDFLKLDTKYVFDNKLITFSYVGGFYTERLLSELLQLVESRKINLLIAGFGDRQFEEKCKKMIDLPNFKYFGRVKYQDGLNIMYNSEIIYAMYSKKNPNHYYAAPNKYYEAMLLGKPILSTRGIILEERIIKNSIGYTVEESFQEMEYLINRLNRKDMKEMGIRAKALWENTYKNKTDDFMNNYYQGIIS